MHGEDRSSHYRGRVPIQASLKVDRDEARKLNLEPTSYPPALDEIAGLKWLLIAIGLSRSSTCGIDFGISAAINLEYEEVLLPWGAIAIKARETGFRPRRDMLFLRNANSRTAKFL
jgi:hypothetical protein